MDAEDRRACDQSSYYELALPSLLNQKIPLVAGMVAVGVLVSVFYYLPFNPMTQTTNQSKMIPFNQTAMLERGNVEMGFNQSMIHHHFMATNTGGVIMIMSTNMSDTRTINEIRSHVRDIQYEFSQGNFTKPFLIHAQTVPGTDVMTAKKDLIEYNVKDIDGGSELVLTTNDTGLLKAIQQFMNFQSSQHMGH